MAIVERLRKIDSPAAREAAFVSGPTHCATRSTFPTASFLVGQCVLGPAITTGAYGSEEEAAAELVGLLRELVDDAIAAGATYVQFDVSGYMMLSASPLAALVTAKGLDLDDPLERMLDADRRAVDGLPDHATTCLHQCRGTTRRATWRITTASASWGRSVSRCRMTASRWSGMATSSAATPTTRRSNGCHAEGRPWARRRQHAASGPRDRGSDQGHRGAGGAARPARTAGPSPQCGFASALTTGDDGRPDGNLIDEEAQWRKLELLVSTAQQIWG